MSERIENENKNKNENDNEQGLADAQLVRRTLNGDDEGFETLVRRYKSLMILVAYRHCGNASDSEDIAQEALLHAYRRLASLDDATRFKGWVLRITSNVAVDLLRRRKGTVSLDDERLSPDMISGPAAKPEQSRRAESNELRRRIVEAIDELPETYQLPAVLRYLEDLTYREIAARTGLRENTLRKRIHRANQLLRRKLKSLGEDT